MTVWRGGGVCVGGGDQTPLSKRLSQKWSTAKYFYMFPEKEENFERLRIMCKINSVVRLFMVHKKYINCFFFFWRAERGLEVSGGKDGEKSVGDPRMDACAPPNFPIYQQCERKSAPINPLKSIVSGYEGEG